MKSFIIYTLLILAPVMAGAQTLDEQFSELKREAYTYKEYKNVKETSLNDFWNVVRDSINTKEKRIISAQSTINAQEEKINELNATIDTQLATIEEKEFDTEHINVLGMDMGKESYKLFNTIAIVFLLVLVGVLFYQFKHSRNFANAKRKDYEKLSVDFEEYKRNALEKQMKLRRELQTERNKIDEIRST
jgi:predicted  nucleic acid-binding Zn-ribbon protein